MNSYMADSLVKGVVIDRPGDHVIVMQYVPRSFYAGSILFLIALSLTYGLYRRNFVGNTHPDLFESS